MISGFLPILFGNIHMLTTFLQTLEELQIHFQLMMETLLETCCISRLQSPSASPYPHLTLS
jgi:hypothetical protein